MAAQLRKRWMIDYDEVSSIGRRYRRQDEIGTPFCITYDFDSLEDKKVTVRDRDTMIQDRVSLTELESYLEEKLSIKMVEVCQYEVYEYTKYCILYTS